MNVGHSRFVLVVGVLCLAAALAPACASEGESEDPTPTPAPAYTLAHATEPGRYAVGSTTYQLVDETRPTSPNRDYPGSDQRSIPIEVWYPAVADPAKPDGRDATPDASDAPYPLIVFAHGFSAIATQSSTYTRHLASHGYVVVAPTFPLTNIAAPGGPRFADLVNQPQDVSFVIDSVLGFSAQSGHFLEGLVDAETIGMTGHSLGGFTTLLSVFGPNRDDRIDAGLPISASGCFLDGEIVGDRMTPMMFLTGSEDLIVPREGNRMAYEVANAPRFWVEIRGGNHVRFADFDIDDAAVANGVISRVTEERQESVTEGQGDQLVPTRCAATANPAGDPLITLERQQELLRTFATPFFAAYLRGDNGARAFLTQDLPESIADAARYEFALE